MDFLSELERQYASLSKSHQKIARYLRANTKEILYLPMTELAKKIDTSPATLMRFARAMGFEGYPGLQRSVQLQAVDAPKRANGSPAAQPQSDHAKLARISELLLATPNVLIVGYMDAFGAAAELFHRLYCVRDGIFFSRLIIDWNDMLRLMSGDTVLLVLSFEPHYSYTLTCVSEARSRGCKVVLMCDNPLNPFAEMADETVIFTLDRRPGSRPGGVDLSPVSGFIHQLMCYIEENCKDRLLNPARHGESFVE